MREGHVLVSDTPTAKARIPLWCYPALLGILVFNVWWRCHTIGPALKVRYGLAPWPVVRGESEPLDCDESLTRILDASS